MGVNRNLKGPSLDRSVILAQLKGIFCTCAERDTLTSPDISRTLLSSIENKSAKAGVIGLGYVGLPLAMTVAKAGFKVVGFDIDPGKITAIEAGRSYIEAVSDEVLASVRQDDGFVATSDFSGWPNAM